LIPLATVFFIGKYASRVDMRWLASIAFIAMSAVSFLYSGFNLQVPFFEVAMMQFLLGVGVAFFFMPVLTILLSDLNISEIASGSGVATFLRTMGGSFAASIVTFMWTHRASIHHARLVENITPYNAQATQAMGMFGPEQHTQALMYINQMITQQGFQISFNEVFFG